MSTNHLSGSSREELSRLDKLFTAISSMQSDIQEIFGSLKPGTKAILATTVLSLFAGLTDVSAQSSQDVIDKNKASTIAKQRPLFIESATFLNQPSVHHWAYTERQKGKTTKSSSDLSGGNATLTKLLDRNKSALPNDAIVLRESEMKQYLTDTISALVMRDVIALVNLSSEWYKNKANINADTRDMEEFPILQDLTLSIDADGLFLKNDTLFVDEKDYKNVVKVLAKKHKVKGSVFESLLANFPVTKMSSKDFSVYKGDKLKQKDIEVLLTKLYSISHDDGKKLSYGDIKSYIDVLTTEDLDDYINNTSYTKADFLAWLTIKKKLLPLLAIPDIASDLDNLISDARKEALTEYRTHLGSSDITTRTNAKTVFIVNLHKKIMAKLSPKIDKFLRHTKEKYTSQSGNQ